MSDKIKAPNLEEIKKRASDADTLICSLASGTIKWTMCVPPQKDDTDMVLIEPVRTDIPELLAYIEDLKSSIMEMRASLEWISQETDLQHCIDEAKNALGIESGIKNPEPLKIMNLPVRVMRVEGDLVVVRYAGLDFFAHNWHLSKRDEV